MEELDVRPVSVAETRALRQQVLRPHQTLDEVAANEPDGAIAVGAFAAGQLIAVGMIAAEGDPGAWRVRGMATDPRFRGRGAGSAVLDALVQHALQSGALRVWCNARTPALSLYQRAGFQAVSAEFELLEIGPHFVMELQID